MDPATSRASRRPRCQTRIRAGRLAVTARTGPRSAASTPRSHIAAPRGRGVQTPDRSGENTPLKVVRMCHIARASTLTVALAAYFTACALAGAAPDISGTYWATTYSPSIEVLGGGEPPLNTAGKAAYEKNRAGLKNGTIVDKARRVCVPDGLPRVLATPYPFEIFQVPAGQVTFLYEMNHQVRVIFVDRPMPSEETLIVEPKYNGHSIGHWDGDTLVVESAGIQRRHLHRCVRPAPQRRNADARTHPQSRQPARGHRHHPRSRDVYGGLAGALRLRRTHGRSARGLRLHS